MMRPLLVCIAAWLVALILTVVFDPEIRAALWVGAILGWGVLDVAGVALAIRAFRLAARAPRSRRLGRFLLAVVAIFALAAFHLAGDHWAFLLRFRLARAAYEARVARIEADLPAGRVGRVEDCLIEPGPPLRVAFILPGGILDNFEAVVYDPTGAVLRGNATRDDPARWHDPASAPIRGFLGGTLISAESLGGPWYRCKFT